jgi:hypothetical protein
MVKFYCEQFETIGAHYGMLLKIKAGIETVDDFLEMTSNGSTFNSVLAALNEPEKKKNKKLKNVESASITETLLQKWGQIFDLFRIPKVTPRSAEMLVNAEINSVQELSHRDPVQVWYKLKELDEASYFITIKEHSLGDIETWIRYAKLLTRRIKYGYDVPLITFPMMNLDYASELQKYKIWTIEDLESNVELLPTLNTRIGMDAETFHEILGLCDLCKVYGIDILIARLLASVDIKSLEQFCALSTEDISHRLEKILPTSQIVKQYPAITEELSIEGISRILEQAKTQEIKTFMGVVA